MTIAAARNKGRTGEREVAAILGGTRRILSGAAGGGDIDHTSFPVGSIWRSWNYEVKRRAKLPALLMHALGQAELDTLAIGDQRKPMVCFREDAGDWFVCMRLVDLKIWAEAIAEIGNGARVRELTRQARRVMQEIEAAIR